VANVDAVLVENIFDIAQGEWKMNVHHYGQADDLGRCFEIAKWIMIFHARTLRLQDMTINTGLV
jgi:hypothetical protein